MTRMTWRGAFASVAAAVVCSVANAAPIPTYKVIDLGFQGTALNNRGQVAGYSSAGALLRDRDGTIHSLGNGRAIDVNAFGQVLGRDDSGFAWIWDPAFGRKGFTIKGATALNDRGRFVGLDESVIDATGYLWDPIFGLTALPQLQAGVFAPLDINNQGTIAGYDDAGHGFGAYAMRNGELVFLEVGDNFGGGTAFSDRANAVNQRGQMTGATNTGVVTLPSGLNCIDTSGECTAAMLWLSDLTPVSLGIFGSGLAISDRGQIVGVSAIEACTVCGFAGAFIWDERFGALDINSLIRASGPIAALHFDWATAINNSGMVIAGTRTGGNVTQGSGRYLLTRVPEPGLPWLLCLALIALGALSVINRRKGRAS